MYGCINFVRSLFGCIFGVILLLISLYFFLDTQKFLGNSARASGTVVQVSSSGSKKSNNTPTVNFQTKAGEKLELQPSGTLSFSQFTVGQKVTVLYEPANPRNFKVDDFLSIWFVTLLSGGFGVLFLFFSLLGLFTSFRRSRRRGYYHDGYYYGGSDSGTGSSDWGNSDGGGLGSSDWGGGGSDSDGGGGGGDSD